MKIRNLKAFKIEPDTVIREFRLSFGKNDYRENLANNLQLRIRRTARKPNLYRREFYVTFGSKKAKIGDFGKISYTQALKIRDEFLTKTPISSPKSPTLAEVFDRYIAKKGTNFSQNTLKKKKNSFKHLSVFENKPVKNIKYSDILEVLNKLDTVKKYGMLKNVFGLSNLIFNFAVAHQILSKNPLVGVKFGDLFAPIASEFGYIDSENEEGLVELINYICNYPNSISVRNALIMGLVSGLRNSNVRFLSTTHLKIDEKGEYYLFFPEAETKTKQQQHLGLPRKMGRWLQNLHPSEYEGLFFPSCSLKPLSDAILSKSLKYFDPSGRYVRGRFVFHSLRKVVATFLNEKMGLRYVNSIDKVLFHSVSNQISRRYNKSSNIYETREVLEFWVNYLDGLGLKW
ncbi:tyrosine-type recombinase/integrase [Campylobacter geochelonis]|uniref:tyrosine-type recombinase/integrase n=1 Tax=Campylobacter geochelonis TaxID=1780362 RepID=UPI00077099C6|nr:tyrosine-type recombinase/integrase [Campylobacter geochelonis]CZE50671.1 integrase phage family protein [Campylobacter geochelonis]